LTHLRLVSRHEKQDLQRHGDVAAQMQTVPIRASGRLGAPRKHASDEGPQRLTDLRAFDEDGRLRVVVEAPRGSPFKLKYEPTLRTFVLHRTLELGLVFPYDWGFIPGTLGEDRDPLDAMVMLESGTWPGVILPARPIAIVRISQHAPTGTSAVTRNDRVIAVAHDDFRYERLEDVPRSLREQLERFFRGASANSGHVIEVEGWEGEDAARESIEAGETRFGRP
jgi:inorganic pyrophosphatase